MNTLKRSFGFRMIKGLAEFSKLKRALTCFISILMRKLFIIKHENITVFIPLQSTDVTEWILLLIKTDLLKVCQSPFWKDRPLSALIEKLVNRPSIQVRPFLNISEYCQGLGRLVGEIVSPSLNLVSLLRQREIYFGIFRNTNDKKYLEEDQLS